MERLENVLSRVGLQRYQDSIVQNGFETWTDLLDITEEDMAELQIKRGHRRILQREIASCRGQAYHQPLSQQQVYQAKPLKRRYRHHPSRDLNAPKRPKSAFVLYSNSLRQNPDVSDLSFVDIAKLTGEKWRSLSSKEVEKWRIDAEEQKKRYSIKLTEYRQTKEFQSHQSRLQIFQDNERKRSVEKGDRGEYDEHNSPEFDCLTSSDDDQRDDYRKPIAVKKGRKGKNSKKPISFYQSPPITLESSKPVPIYQIDVLGQQSKYNEYKSSRNSINLEIQHHSPTAPTASLEAHQPSITIDHTAINRDNVGQDTDISFEDIRSSSLYVYNPFCTKPRTTIWPLLASFLLRINSVHHFIDAEYLITQFHFAVNNVTRLPKHVIYTLCLCVSLGRQAYDGETDELAIVWYEHGRRYLDDDDWGWSLSVMRALALISMFHKMERPSTAGHYLDTALRIGKANNLSLNMSHCSSIDSTADNENGTKVRIMRTFEPAGVRAEVGHLNMARRVGHPDSGQLMSFPHSAVAVSPLPTTCHNSETSTTSSRISLQADLGNRSKGPKAIVKMIGSSIEYVALRTCIIFLHNLAPASLLYSAFFLVSFFLDPKPYAYRLSFAVDVWLLSEAAFYTIIFLPYESYLQRAAVHPEPLSPEERANLFARCNLNVPDPEKYIRQWLLGAKVNDIKRENVKEFIRWAFWNAGDILHRDEDEVEDYVKAFEELLGRIIPHGKGSARSLRLTLDKVNCSRRSLFWYLCVSVVDTITFCSLLYDGFYFHRTSLTHFVELFPFRPLTLLSAYKSPVKHLTYWHRPHTSRTRLPILFIHGIGIGLYPYTKFLRELNTRGDDGGDDGGDGDVGIIALEIMPISSRITHSALGKEVMVREIQNIIRHHGWTKMAVVSHSYGSIIVTHLLKSPLTAPTIGNIVLIDPVSFLLHLPDVAYNFTARQPVHANEHLLWYFGSRDIGVAHTLARRFFWSENIIWKEDLGLAAEQWEEGRKVTVVLGGKDSLIDTNTVGRYLIGASIKRPQISHITTGTVRDIKTALDSGLISAEGEDWKTRPWIGSGLEILWFEQLDHGQAFTLERARRSIIKAIEVYTQKKAIS